ncbi:MAG TPA: ABC transporter substrate-binding protein [Candidatus Methylomirabilis sp.]|nr:ABC transporter substrate-binding protein [Candidatus Methylomirabilis sp.]
MDRPMRRWLPVLGLGLSVALVVASLGRADTKMTKLTVGLPTPPSAGNMWLEVAKVQGWDKELGLDLQLQRATGGGAVTALVVGGGADIGLGLPDALMNAVAQGQDLVAFWKVQPPGVPVFWVLGRKDAGITSWKDLKGKKIGILGPASATKYSTDLMLFANGVDPKDVEYVSLGGVGAYVEALKAKRVDAVGSWHDPNETVFKPSPLWAELTALPATLYQGDVYLAKRDFVTKNRDTIVNFDVLLMKAVSFYLDNPDKAVDLARARIPELAAIDRDKSIQSIIVLRPTRSRTGLFDLEDMQKYVPLAVKAGLVKGLDPAKFDPSKYFLNDYAKAAAAKLNQ